MRKWLIAFSLLAALLGLAACGGPKADVAEQPHVWEFGNTCVNANGERVLGPGRPDEYYSILEDSQGRQRYIMSANRTYTDPDGDEYPEMLASEYQVYDLQGQLLKSVQLAGETGVYFSADRDLAKSLIVRDLLQTEGKYQVLDLDGKVLLEKAVTLPNDYFDTSVYLCLNENFFVVNMVLYNEDGTGDSLADVYDWQWQPLMLGGVYPSIFYVDYPFGLAYDYGSYYYNGYFRAGSSSSIGPCSFLDKQGKVIAADLDELYYIGGDLFWVQKGERRGVINNQGEFVFQPGQELNATAGGLDGQVYYLRDNYTYYIINAAGQPILGPSAEYEQYTILMDYQYQPFYLMSALRVHDPERRDGNGDLLQVENLITFYDLAGQQLHQVSFPMNGVWGDIEFDFAPNGDLQKSCFLLDRLDTEGKYQIYDAYGNLLAERQVCQPEDWGDCYATMYLSDDYVIVNYLLQALEPDETGWYYFEEHADVYRLDGQLVELEQNYSLISPIIDEADGLIIGYQAEVRRALSEESNAYLLDDDMQQVWAGRSIYPTVWGGLLQAEQDGQRGLIDMQGNWIYREPLPEED